MENKMLKIAIAGASGFVGKRLIAHLLSTTEHQIIALSRFPKERENPRVEWRACDLFSLLEIERALLGVDIAYYLVHSMLPSANLDQGNFADYDLLLADNFARSANHNQLKQVIYLGGLLPQTPKLSKHLASRFEVEEVFRGKNFQLTTFRAGLIIGKNGSSFKIMFKLVKRLPVLICPLWVDNPMTPIDVDDAVKSLGLVINEEKSFGKVYDISGSGQYTYLQLMKILSDKIGADRLFLKVPVHFVGFSKLWVRLITGESKELVYPLLDSIRHPMVCDEERRFKIDDYNFKTFEQSLVSAIETTTDNQRTFFIKKNHRFVRSVQRLPIPDAMNAQDVALEYMKWLPKMFAPFIQVVVFNDEVDFSLFHHKFVLLKLKYSAERSTPTRALFYIVGGILARTNKKSRLEFRETLPVQGERFVITAIHDFEPTLPWPLYVLTQAQIHLQVMHAFGRHLKGLGRSVV